MKLHELIHPLATDGRARPRLIDGIVHYIPVKVALFRPGEDKPYMVLDAADWVILPQGEGLAKGVPEFRMSVTVPWGVEEATADQSYAVANEG